MRVRDILKTLLKGQYVEFLYESENKVFKPYRTSEDIYQHGYDSYRSITKYFNNEIISIYSDVEGSSYDVDYDLIVVVMKEEK